MPTIWGMAAETKIDEQLATQMVEQGTTVRGLADRFGVSTQAIYIAIRKGRIPAPNARLGSTPLACTNSTPPDAACAGNGPPRA